jgi:hypothetical protein
VSDLAARQQALVAALTEGAPVPPGFDPRLMEVTRVALLRKRAGEVARQWPELAATPHWHEVFAAWAAARPTRGSLRDGWDLARDQAKHGRLPPGAAAELAAREAAWRYDGRTPPRRRRAPALRSASGAIAVQFAGRVRILRPAKV